MRFSDVRIQSTSSILGLVTHSLLAEAARGEFSNLNGAKLESLVAARWDKLMEVQEHRIQERAFCTMPTRKKWPKYALKRATACRAASRIARSRGARQPKVGHAGSDPNAVQSEVWYEGYGGQLVGRIDLIRRTTEGIEVIDYKSGLITEGDAQAQPNRLRETYLRQILLYSALVFENEGCWPYKITLESLIQGSHVICLVPERALGAANEALRLLETYNRQASVGAVQAQPSSSACIWCDYKAVCSAFLGSADETWRGPEVTVKGQLRSVNLDPPLFLVLDVEGGDHPMGLITIRRIPLNLAHQLKGLEGTTLSFGGLRRTRGFK